jgi:flagellar protein FliO/FliZ
MDTVAMVGRLLLSLAAVLGLMWVLARRVKRPGRTKSTRLIDVLGRQQLSRTSSVAVIRVMDQALILGVTDGQVTVIGETDLEAVQARLEAVAAPRKARPARRTVTAPDGAPPRRSALTGSALSPNTWRQTIETLRDLTARSSR